jgi:4a-hydroxytetrahydrobiopterin dehydratase
MNHHPDLLVGWRKVTMRVSTHSAGGLTELDVALAREADRIAA